MFFKVDKSTMLFAGLFSVLEKERRRYANFRMWQREMRQVNDKYDRQLIRLSGFEW